MLHCHCHYFDLLLFFLFIRTILSFPEPDKLANDPMLFKIDFQKNCLQRRFPSSLGRLDTELQFLSMSALKQTWKIVDVVKESVHIQYGVL